jgi:hypothetical protein
MENERSRLSDSAEFIAVERRLRENELVLNSLMDKMIELRQEFQRLLEHPCSRCENKIEIVRLTDKIENNYRSLERLWSVLRVIAFAYGGTLSLLVIQTLWSKMIGKV